MPQLVKGGKFIFGLSRVGSKGTIVIPPQAIEEYRFRDGDHVILMNGSRRSGGFGLTTRIIIEKSEIVDIIDNLPEVFDYRTLEADVVSEKNRLFCWTTIKSGGYIELPHDTLSRFGVKSGDMLAGCRGSYLSVAFISRGPILDECRTHPELQVFKITEE